MTNRWHRLPGAALLCMLLVSVPSMVSAQEARELFLRGQSAYDSGDYDTALQAWGRAYELDPRPLMQFNMAQAYERLGRLGEAIEAYSRFIADAPADAEQMSAARARAASLQQRLGNTGIQLVGGPEGAVVLVDGQDRGRLPRPDPIRLQPGSHRVVVRAPGYEDFVSVVGVSPGQSVSIPVEMRPGETGRAPTGGGGGGVSPVGLAIAGVGGALVVAGAVTGGLALASAGSAPDATGPQADEARTLALVTDILLPVGLAAAAAGIVLAFVLESGGSSGESAAVVVPVAGPDSIGIAALGTF